MIQIGENDADRQSSDGRSLTLARDILSVAQWLVDGFSVRHVVIMQLLHRASARNLPVESYNANIDRVNSEYERAARVAVTARSGSTKDYEQR